MYHTCWLMYVYKCIISFSQNPFRMCPFFAVEQSGFGWVLYTLYQSPCVQWLTGILYSLLQTLNQSTESRKRGSVSWSGARFSYLNMEVWLVNVCFPTPYWGYFVRTCIHEVSFSQLPRVVRCLWSYTCVHGHVQGWHPCSFHVYMLCYWF